MNSTVCAPPYLGGACRLSDLTNSRLLDNLSRYLHAKKTGVTMGWGGRSAIRKGGRGRGGGAHILNNPSVHQIKGATLSLNSAIAEYGISRADLEDVPLSLIHISEPTRPY